MVQWTQRPPSSHGVLCLIQLMLGKFSLVHASQLPLQARSWGGGWQLSHVHKYYSMLMAALIVVYATVPTLLSSTALKEMAVLYAGVFDSKQSNKSFQQSHIFPKLN